MNPSIINPYIRVAMPSVIARGHRIRRRVIFDYELIYLERGTFTLTYADKEYSCTEGDVLLLCPGVPHSFTLGEREISQPHIHFDMTHRLESEKIPVSFKDISDMTKEEQGWIHQNYFATYLEHPFVIVRNKKHFLSLFYAIISRDTDTLTKKGLLTQLIALLIQDNFPDLFEASEPDSVARRIKDYIDAGHGFDMSLDDFSKQFSYSKFHLEKQFKLTFGKGLMHYRNDVRMQHAKRLLQTKSVSDVAEEMGFQSIYAFSRAFKNHFGVAPTKSKK